MQMVDVNCKHNHFEQKWQQAPPPSPLLQAIRAMRTATDKWPLSTWLAVISLALCCDVLWLLVLAVGYVLWLVHKVEFCLRLWVCHRRRILKLELHCNELLHIIKKQKKKRERMKRGWNERVNVKVCLHLEFSDLQVLIVSMWYRVLRTEWRWTYTRTASDAHNITSKLVALEDLYGIF